MLTSSRGLKTIAKRQSGSGSSVALESQVRHDSSVASASPREGRAWIRVRGRDARANAAREGSGARRPGRRGPAEPQRPWEPGSARVFRDRRACGGPRPGGSCRPQRVRGPPAARGEGERRGRRRLRGPGCGGSALQHRRGTGQPARGFPPRTVPVQTPYCGRSRSGSRRLSLPLPGSGAPPDTGGVLGSRSQGWGVTAQPAGAQPVPPPSPPERPAGSASGAPSPASRGAPTSAPRAGAAGGAAAARPPASQLCPQPDWAAPLPPEPQRSR